MTRLTALFAVVATATACSSAPETPDVAPAHEAEHQHRFDPSKHDADHRFEDPEQYAAAWNDPQRDEWQKPAEVVASMAIAPGMTVADLGTGTGYFVGFLSEAVGPEGKVFALDIEGPMVDYVQKRAIDNGWNNVHGKRIEPATPGVEGIDRFLVVNTWHHIKDREGYSAKLLAALNEGGSVHVVDYEPEAEIERGPPKRIRLAPETVVAELTAGGFKAEVVEETLPHQYIVVGRK